MFRNIVLAAIFVNKIFKNMLLFFMSSKAAFAAELSGCNG